MGERRLSTGALGEGGGAMSQISPCNNEGEGRKRDAHALLESRRRVYVLRGRRALLARLLATGRATADDVRDAVDLPRNVNPVCLGAVPTLLARAGIIESEGFTKSRRPDAHARPVQVWRLVNRAAALAWLVDNPDRPDPTPEEGAGPVAGQPGPRSPDVAASAIA